MQTEIEFASDTYQAAMLFVKSLEGELMKLNNQGLRNWILEEVSPHHNIPERPRRRKKMPFVLWNNLRVKYIDTDHAQAA